MCPYILQLDSGYVGDGVGGLTNTQVDLLGRRVSLPFLRHAFCQPLPCTEQSTSEGTYRESGQAVCHQHLSTLDLVEEEETHPAGTLAQAETPLTSVLEAGKRRAVRECVSMMLGWSSSTWKY